MVSTALLVMAAGMGSRFGGLKQIEPIGPHGEAILDFSVYDAREAGFDRVVFVIKKEIDEAFRESVGRRAEKILPVSYAYQDVRALPAGFLCPPEREKPWGTGQAVLCAREAIDSPFAVINADDYYGREALRLIHDHLVSRPEEDAMVAFRLKNTLTENGTVSRGVCEVEKGFLRSITERTKIRSDGAYLDGDLWVPLDPDTPVSMNLWGFSPENFSALEQDFRVFLSERLSEPKAEFYLPSVVEHRLAEGRRVRVLESGERWYGVTYREDKEPVTEALRRKIAQGLYFTE